MKKLLSLWFKILGAILMVGIFSVLVHFSSESVCLNAPFLLIIMLFAAVLIYGGILEYRGVPGLKGSARYKSPTEVELYWDVHSLPDGGGGEFIILRKVESSDAFVEVGRSFGPTFIDITVDSTKTNYYQIFEGRDAIERNNRFYTPILELKPFKS